MELGAAAHMDGLADGLALVVGGEIDDRRSMEMGEEALGMIAGGRRLGHARGAVGEESGQQDARFQLGAGNGQLVSDAGQRAAGNFQRCGVLVAFARDLGAHLDQRIDDPFHGAAGK